MTRVYNAGMILYIVYGLHSSKEYVGCSEKKSSNCILSFTGHL